MFHCCGLERRRAGAERLRKRGMKEADALAQQCAKGREKEGKTGEKR